jgi:D-ribitol-5-phosphate cytidylyltransferase
MKEKKLGAKVKNLVSSVKTHWTTPPEGRYVPYKEIAAYSVGGIGVKFVIYTAWYIGLSATSLLAGSALGLKNGDLVKLTMIATVIGIFLVPLRGMIIDNTRSSKGKFRPYLLYTGIPSGILLTGFAFLPFESMSYNQKLWALFITYELLQLCYPFYDQAYTTLVQVMSPNSTERADVITISTFIYSLAPTILGFLVPILAGFTGGLEHINAYRIIMPIFGIGGALIGLFSYTGTKERIIVAKDYTPKVPFFKGIGAGIQNKYQWARSITGWLILLQGGIGSVTTWYFYYGIKDVLGLSTQQQGVLNGTLTTILGAAATPAMLLAPLLIRKVGKRNLFIIYILGTTVSMIGMFLFIKQYLTVKDKPIIIYTIEKFISVPRLEKILVLCPSKWVEHTKNLIAKHIAPAADRVAVIEGGSTRNETIMNAIRYIENEGNLNDDTIIVTHDSVRPFVTYRIIEENIASAEQFGACDTVIPATDTIVESQDHQVISAIPDRSVMYQGQTPQSFRATKLKKLYEALTEEEKEILTDAAKIFVIKGEPVALVQGETYNMKITYPYDLRVAKSLLEDETHD